MSEPVLTPTEYLSGLVWLAVVGGGLVLAARSVRHRWFSGSAPLPALLVQVVVGLAILSLVPQVLGSIGMLRAAPVAGGVLVVCIGIALLSRRRPQTQAQATPTVVPSPRGERWVAALAVAAVLGQWVAHTASALRTGMLHADTLWYHAPFSARFLQLDSLGELGALGYSQARYYPLGSETLHATIALPFQRDLLSPSLNLAFAALALLAAAILGGRWGVGARAVLAMAAVLALPTLAGTQPGQASNDVVAIALVLTAMALLVHVGGGVPGMVVGGAALGLAAGTKMTVLALCGPLALFGAIGAWRLGHRTGAAAWLATSTGVAAFWPARNLVLAGTPVPFLDFEVFGWHHVARTSTSGTPSLASTLFSDTGWSIVDGLDAGFGSAWPLVLALLLGAVFAAVRGPQALRPSGLATLVAALAYPFTPFTGEGSFQFNLRYLTPALAASAVLFAIASRGPRYVRSATTAALGAVVVAALAAPHHERVAAWPGYWPLVAATAVALLGVAFLVDRAAGRSRPRPSRAAPAALAVVAAVGVLGWPLQEHHLQTRYVDAGLHDDALHEQVQSISGAHIAVIGTPETYPFFGADLSNVVVAHNEHVLFGAPVPEDPCRLWRSELRGADLIALSSFGHLMRRFGPDDRRDIFTSDPAVTVLHDADAWSLYRVDGGLDPAAC